MTVQKQSETELSEKDKKLLDSYGITETTKITFFVRTPKMLFWLSVLTLNVYDVYWFYKNWQAVQKVSTKKISPFWRSIFTLFYIWPLLRLMSLQAKARGMQKSYDPVRLAVMYLLVSYLGLVLSRSPSAFGETASWFGLLATCPLAAWVLLLMQRAAAFNNGKVDKSSAPSGVLPAQLKLGKVEKVIVIISAIFLVLATI